MSALEAQLRALLTPRDPKSGGIMVDLACSTLMQAQDVRIATHNSYVPGVIHFQRQPGSREMVVVIAHPSHHEALVEVLDAWREAKEAEAMGPPCDRCKGSERVWVSTDSPDARAYVESFGLRVKRFKEPVVEIVCPCACHQEA